MKQQPDAVEVIQGDHQDHRLYQVIASNAHPLVDSVSMMDADKVAPMDPRRRDGGIDDQADRTTLAASSSSFIATLMRILDDAETLGFEDVVGWEKDDKSFRVRITKDFETTIMPKYLNQTRIRSFQRQLIAHGFTRVQGGPDRGTYRHPVFDRKNPSRSLLITKLPSKKSKHRSFLQPAAHASPLRNASRNATSTTASSAISNHRFIANQQQQQASTDPSMSSHFMQAAFESRPWFVKKRNEEMEQIFPSRGDILLGRFSSASSQLKQHNDLRTQFIQQDQEGPFFPHTPTSSSAAGYTPLKYPQEKGAEHESPVTSYTPSHPPDMTPSMLKSACPYPMSNNKKIDRLEAVQGILNEASLDVSDPAVGFLHHHPLDMSPGGHWRGRDEAQKKYKPKDMSRRTASWSASSSLSHPATLPDAQELTSISLF